MLVLIVEDNQIHSYVLRKILQAEGFNVIEAHTGLDGLLIARTEHPAVVLLDLNLPDVDGYEVCKKLKSSPETRDISVIFYSAAEATPDYILETRRSGAAGFLTYPVSNEELRWVVLGAAARTPTGGESRMAG
jgi:CheY-like chemotaxis protein